MGVSGVENGGENGCEVRDESDVENESQRMKREKEKQKTTHTTSSK